MSDHVHDWHELGRAFDFVGPEGFPGGKKKYVEALSPDGGHVFEKNADGETVGALHPASHPKLIGKVPLPTPHIILQCQDPDCPDGPKHTIHVELHKAEWEKIKKAYDEGVLDPDHNGTNRYVSQLSLTDLGLGRIEQMLGVGRRSGARETISL